MNPIPPLPVNNDALTNFSGEPTPTTGHKASPDIFTDPLAADATVTEAVFNPDDENDRDEIVVAGGDTYQAVPSAPELPDEPDAKSDQSLLERVTEAMESFHTRAKQYEATNRLLHSRIEDLQNDQIRSLLKPVFERLATMQAQATEAAQSARDRDSSSASDLEFFAISITELLALYDVESVGAITGALFDPKIHHGARTVATTDEELDGTIHRVQRQGYKFAGAERIMLPARVSVHRYKAPAETAPADLEPEKAN